METPNHGLNHTVAPRRGNVWLARSFARRWIRIGIGLIYGESVEQHAHDRGFYGLS